ncbi:hypothetical protein HGI47_13385 [Novosphingobium sp. ERN07]|uniref:outer membrane protein n=1 Tax=Novosphingobium sp. ERN07 TaxID=2726187 RepID=UPI0014574C80|nr:hypothetical protein [Novosphingobium sp. ERN07]NLR71864.1 hypothetical protein [Novosphingobium sp. ERN07]
MRLVLISLAASLVAATPALANEARVEARGGIVWNSTDSEEIAGVAAGYDFDLGETAFAGGEVSADKLLTDGTKVTFGFAARAGAKIGEAGKLYGIGGYNTENCDGCEGAWSLGAGYQHSFGKFYAKAEYRHFFPDNALFTDTDAAIIGLGVKF